jgi:hypothetical protein
MSSPRRSSFFLLLFLSSLPLSSFHSHFDSAHRSRCSSSPSSPPSAYSSSPSALPSRPFSFAASPRPSATSRTSSRRPTRQASKFPKDSRSSLWLSRGVLRCAESLSPSAELDFADNPAHIALLLSELHLQLLPARRDWGHRPSLRHHLPRCRLPLEPVVN